MFLTTNRVTSIDDAFESRIDLALTYNKLSEPIRRQIWQNFIQRFEVGLKVGQANISPHDLDILSKISVNGRQIKSALKTARILANHQKEPLGLAQLQVVLEIRASTSKALGIDFDEDQVKAAFKEASVGVTIDN